MRERVGGIERDTSEDQMRSTDREGRREGRLESRRK